MSHFTYMVTSNSATVATNLTLEQAAHMLLTADGHTYETRESDGFVELWISRFSVNSTKGARDKVRCTVLARRSEAELWEWVVNSDFDWCGLSAYTQRYYQVMLDALVSNEVRSEPRGDAFDTLEAATAFALELGRGAWIDVRESDGRYYEHYDSEDLGLEPVEEREG